MKRRFIQCNVFSPDPGFGNGLAVVLDAEGLSTEDMQRFAAWTDPAETTFVTAPTVPDADYSMSIFSPGREMKFTVHPTLGSCAAWLATGGTTADAGRVRQHCAIGIVEIDLSGDDLAFAAPETRMGPMDPSQKDRFMQALQLPPEAVRNAVTLENGSEWYLLELESAEATLAVDANPVSWQ